MGKRTWGRLTGPMIGCLQDISFTITGGQAVAIGRCIEVRKPT